MDTLRGDEDHEVKHHGTVRTVAEKADGHDPVVPFAGSNLRHRDEQKEVNARKEYYKHIKQKQMNKKTMKFCKKLGKKIIPTDCILFTIICWSYGLSQL